MTDILRRTIRWTAALKASLFMLFLVFMLRSTPYADDYFELRDGLSNSRLVFERTGKGRVVFLGGSITAMKGWRELVCSDLKKRFPNTEFDFINAGIPSTGSTPGSFRLVRDAFKNGKVDLLFEEAAVNDFYNGRSGKEQVRAMEGIVRHARKLNPNIDIILMYFVDPEKIKTYNEGKIPDVIQNHEKVAVHYRLPSINMALEVTERINHNEFTWENDFNDLHPAPFGHTLYSNAIARLFDEAWLSRPAENSTITAHKDFEKLDEYCYDAATLVSPDRADELDGFRLDPKWINTVGGTTRPEFVDVPMLVAHNPGDSFALSFRGSAIGLFVAAGPDAGIIEYRIDDGSWKKQDLFTKWSAGLHIPWLYVLEAELEKTTPHRLKVRISSEKNQQSTDHACRIVNFAINQEFELK